MVGADTVLVCGLMYHINDHMEVIKSIAKAVPKHIIVETLDSLKNMNSDIPSVITDSEIAYGDRFAGWEKNFDTISRGFPNAAWFLEAFANVGYSMIRQSLTLYQQSEILGFKKIYRSVYVFKRNV
jgi:hypothetical protein